MKRVALVFAFIAILTIPAIAVAAGSTQTAAPGSEIDAQMAAGVTIVDFAFQPAFVVVSAGGTVSWFNAGGAPHTATSPGVFDSGTIGSGGGSSATLWTPGTYSYFCAIHPSMVGTVQVN